MLEPQTKRFIEYFNEYQRDELGHYIQNHPDVAAYTIDFTEFRNAHPDIADDMIRYPDDFLDMASTALNHVDVPHIDEIDEHTVRVSTIPEREVSLSELRQDHQGQLVTLRAQVSKTTEVRPKVVEAVFECQDCHAFTDVTVVGENISLPNECDGCETSGPFTLDEQKSEMQDHQIIELQPRADDDAMNLQRSIPAHLYNDLVDTVAAGDRVKVTGILRTEDVANERQISARRPQYLEGLHIDKEQQDFASYNTERIDEIEDLANSENLQELLVRSFAPNILTGERGDKHKLAILLQLFGGVEHTLPNNSTLRNDINILLIGAPGTGKSQYLNYAESIAPKAVKASGKGATAAGLTATATQPEFGDGWMLDAGALVMASGGLACIDEFDKMENSARKSMHEAMEDQEIPINKAGINTTLTSKTAVLAAANPEGGSFDRFEPLSEQINLGEALITRFDLVFALGDSPDKEQDREIATHQYNITNEGNVEPAIEAELLREYIAYARQNVEPAFSNQNAVDMLVDKYVDTRQENGEGDDVAVPVTARMNESLRRLSEAAARSELSEVVEPRHAEIAIELYQLTMGDIGVTEDGELDAAKAAGNKPQSQQQQISAVLNAVKHEDCTVEEIMEQTGMDRSDVENRLETLLNQREVYEPEQGVYAAV